MADIIDVAQEAIELEEAERMAKLKPYDVPPGTPGECEVCGSFNQRLLATSQGMTCPRCRDELGLCDAREKHQPKAPPRHDYARDDFGRYIPNTEEDT